VRPLLVALGVVLFAAPGSATPRLGIGQVPVLASPTAVGVAYQQFEGDPAPSRITIHVPDAYEFTPHADGVSPGTTIGFDDVQVTPPFGDYPATGLITMEDAGTFADEAVACTGSAGHDAVWAAHIGSTTGVIAMPIFVDGHGFTFCPNASRLGGTPTLVSFQLGLLSSSGVAHSLLTGPKTRGSFVWSATVERAGMSSVEIRSIVDLPQRAMFTARLVRNAVRITGRVTANGRGIGGVRIEADAVKRRARGFDAAFHARTRSDGRFTIVHRIRRGTYYVRVRAYRDDVTTNSCAGASSAAGGCVSTTRNGFGLEAKPAAIRIHP
jgi:hypothetical protein